MQHISNLSIAVMYVMYFLAALFGYLTFYGMAGPAGAGVEARLGSRGWPAPWHPACYRCFLGVIPDCALQLWR